jgi:poly(A) polymerase/tRNA nucleotidyltransferase (CCA-adding enzyme)
MQKTEVLPLVFPEADVAVLHRLIEHGAPAEPMLRVAALVGGKGQEFAGRLKLSGAEAELLLRYTAPNTLDPNASDADLRRALADDEAEILVARTWLAQRDAAGCDELRKRVAAMPRPVFPLQGRDVLALGIAAGPRVGEILGAARAWWWENGCVDDLERCLEKARNIRTS